jgi:hypothetical protein
MVFLQAVDQSPYPVVVQEREDAVSSHSEALLIETV